MMEKDERRALRKALRIIDDFRALDSDIPIQQVATFLIVALQEEMAVKDVCERLGLATSTASRNIAALSKVHRLGKPGLDLVVNRENPANRREKMISLTPKGAGLRHQIINTLLDE